MPMPRKRQCITVPCFNSPIWFVGVVVSVIEEGRRPYVVTIQAEEGLGGGGGASFVLTVPMDARVPKIRIKTRQLSKV